MSREIRGNVPQEPAHALHKSYGIEEVPSLVRALASADPVLRSKAIDELCDAVHRPENAASALKAGMIPVVLRVLEEKPENAPDVRAKAAEALSTCALHRDARSAAAAGEEVAKSLIASIDDQHPPVRSQALVALARFVEDDKFLETAGRLRLVETLVVKIFSTKSSSETISVIDAVAAMCKTSLGFARRAVAANGVAALAELLENESQVRVPAAHALSLLAQLPEGRKAVIACNEKAVGWLVSCMSMTSTPLASHAAGICSSVAIENDGKAALIKAGAISAAVELVRSCGGGERHLLPVIQMIAGVAEAPQGRSAFLATAVEPLERIVKSKQASELEQRAATRAIKVIRWKP